MLTITRLSSYSIYVAELVMARYPLALELVIHTLLNPRDLNSLPATERITQY